MNDSEWDRGEMLQHADEIAKWLAQKTTLTAKQAYVLLMQFIDATQEGNTPEEEE